MFIQQLYTNCLSGAAYYIESANEAVVIDPLRDTAVYTNLAKERKATVKYIFETHFHADFVSGHIDLSQQTGAPIVYGPGTETNYPVTVAKDGDTFKVGNISFEVLHTPGHTIESTCYLLRNEENAPHAVFTGDTLFVGEVGRPDLSLPNSQLTTKDLAGMLYDSLQQKIVPLPDPVLVYPAHGPGSNCGKNLGANTHSTIGIEKETNYALKATTKAAFIEAVIEGLPVLPKYFSINAKMNKEGYASLEGLLAKALTPLPVAQFATLIENPHYWILDTRPATLFTHGFIPGSINIGLEGRFAEWAGMLLPFDKPIVLVTEHGKEEETAIRLARVGIDKIEGFLQGGYNAWKEAEMKVDMIIDVEADELAMDIPHDVNILVVDVRNVAEFADGHIANATNVPLHEMSSDGYLEKIEAEKNIYLHCAGGYRSVIAASLLKREGVHHLRNILGGWNAIKEQSTITVAKENSVLN
jgi:hydroxyacylglutathione hydrolase